MDNKNNSSSNGIGLCTILTIVFIVLKLCNKISWSWLWVLSPMWIVAIIYILVALGVIVYLGIKHSKNKRKK